MTTSVIAEGKYISPLKQTLFIQVESEVHLRIFNLENGLHLGESVGSSKTACLLVEECKLFYLIYLSIFLYKAIKGCLSSINVVFLFHNKL